MKSLASHNICFIGCGAMAEAIIRGLLEKRKIDPGHISVINRTNRNRLVELKQKYRIHAGIEQEDRKNCLQQADILILAVKPKDVDGALQYVRHWVKPDQLLLSVVAGLSIHAIEAKLGQSLPIVRTMPNTSSSIGLGATGIAFSRTITEEQRKLAADIFHSVGIVTAVEEPMLDVITGLSGSGPAYVYYLMEAMIAAGVEQGLTEASAKELTLQTVLGAVNMVSTTNEEPINLRHKVMSPGGTTQAAIEILDQHQFYEGIKKAVARASERAKELGAAVEKSTTG